MVRAVFGSLCCAVVAACSLPLPPPSPLLPAPPFQYIARPRLQSAMWRLADGVTAVDHLLDEAPPDAAGVLAALDDMQAAVATLSSPGQQTNHPRLDQELPRFALEIAAARDDAARDPPQYAGARALSSSCLRCHGGDR